MKPGTILGRALLLVVVPSLVLVALLAGFTHAQRRQAEAQRLSLHTRDVLEAAQQLSTHLADAQTGIRGVIIARDASFLTSYERARAVVPAAFDRLLVLTADNPAQQARVRSLQAHATVLLAHHEAVREEVRRGSPTRERERELITRQKALMDDVRVAADELRREELRLDAVRQQAAARESRRLFAVVVGGTVASLVSVIGLGLWFHRGLSRRVTRLAGTAQELADGRDAGPMPAIDDELTALDRALRDMAAALAQRQRAAVGALADAVSLFSAADSRRAVLDVAVERAITLTGAGVALCTLDDDPRAPHTVVAAAAAPDHPTGAPECGTSFAWEGAAEVLRTNASARRTPREGGHGAPPHVERVLAGGEWLGVRLVDRRTPIGMLQVAARPGRTFRDGDRDVIGALAQAASVALALERSRQRLEAVNADLALTNRENELFVFSVSHDLRSPLVNLEGFSRELAAAADGLRAIVTEPDVPEPASRRALAIIDDDIGESVRFIRTAVGRLAGIIDGLLRLSRAGRVDYRVQALPLARVLQRIVDAMHASITEAGAEVHIGPLPEVAGDALAIEQVFANLIGNALTYTRPGTVPRVDVTVEDEFARDRRFTVVRVRDNGLGIPDPHLEKVFQPLQRLHPEVGRGEGMGLAIVRRIVERHDGRVWVTSRAGEGTTFYVELPRQPLEESSDAA